MSSLINVRLAEILLELVSNYPVLYDQGLHKYKESLLKDDLCNKIGNEQRLTGKYEFLCLCCFAPEIVNTF